jgi:hypothetical protein
MAEMDDALAAAAAAMKFGDVVAPFAHFLVDQGWLRSSQPCVSHTGAIPSTRVGDDVLPMCFTHQDSGSEEEDGGGGGGGDAQAPATDSPLAQHLSP